MTEMERCTYFSETQCRYVNRVQDAMSLKSLRRGIELFCALVV